jgi:hypothetical protein
MKKLLILSVLLGLMALPMFASDITFGGDLKYGFIGDFGDTFAEATDITFDIKAAIDDYSSLTINVDGLETQVDGLGLNGVDGVDISKALVATDIGAWLGLPVGLVASWGFDDPDVNEFQNISDYGNEDPWDASPNEYWGHTFVVSVSMAEVKVAFDPGLASADAGRLLAALAVMEPIPGLNAEFYYFQDEVVDDFGEGFIGFDAAYAGDFGGFGVEAGAWLGYNLSDVGDAWALGVGLSGAYSIATVTVGLDGNETDALNTVSATAVVAPIDLLDIYAGMWYDMANSELAEIDLGVNAHVGAVQVYVGYLVDGDSPAAAAGDNFNSPAGLASGENGAYIKFDVDY